MKAIKALFSVTMLFSLLATTVHAQGIEKTLVKSFNLQQASELHLDLKDVTVEDWSEDYVRVKMEIQFPINNEAMFRSLITAGRYNLVAQEKDQGMVITAPNIDREIKLGGKVIKEQISYIVYALENLSVQFGWRSCCISRYKGKQLTKIVISEPLV